MIYNDKDLKILADLIAKYIREDFEEIHLSGNLMDTIMVTRTTLGFDIDIPAFLYDINTYRKKGVIVYEQSGSYAQEVNITGGFSGKHVNYVERAIEKAIKEWLVKMKVSGKVRFK